MKKIIWVLVIVLTVATAAVTSFASDSSNDSLTNQYTSTRLRNIFKIRDTESPIFSKEEMQQFKSTIDPSMTREEVLVKAQDFVNKKIKEGKITDKQGEAFLNRIKNCPEPGKGHYKNLTLEQKKDLFKNKVNKLKEKGIITDEESKDILDKIEQGNFSFMEEFHQKMRNNRPKLNNGS